MSATTTKLIRVSGAFAKLDPPNVVVRGYTVHQELGASPLAAKSPVTMDDLKAGVDTLSTAITEAEDGGQKALAALQKQVKVVVKMLRLIKVYVDTVADNDPTIIAATGFEFFTVTKSKPQRLPPASIRRIDQRISGQFLIMINAIPKARSFELRYALVTAGVIGQ